LHVSVLLSAHVHNANAAVGKVHAGEALAACLQVQGGAYAGAANPPSSTEAASSDTSNQRMAVAAASLISPRRPDAALWHSVNVGMQCGFEHACLLSVGYRESPQ
jgi:hypothetical protein